MNNTILPRSDLRYSIDTLKEEINCLLEKRVVERRQPLYVLLEHLPAKKWLDIECELERYDYLLRDSIGDLVGDPKWQDD